MIYLVLHVVAGSQAATLALQLVPLHVDKPVVLRGEIQILSKVQTYRNIR